MGRTDGPLKVFRVDDHEIFRPRAHHLLIQGDPASIKKSSCRWAAIRLYKPSDHEKRILHLIGMEAGTCQTQGVPRPQRIFPCAPMNPLDFASGPNDSAGQSAK